MWKFQASRTIISHSVWCRPYKWKLSFHTYALLICVLIFFQQNIWFSFLHNDNPFCSVKIKCTQFLPSIFSKFSTGFTSHIKNLECSYPHICKFTKLSKSNFGLDLHHVKYYHHLHGTKKKLIEQNTQSITFDQFKKVIIN